jgi:hypothetical protein
LAPFCTIQIFAVPVPEVQPFSTTNKRPLPSFGWRIASALLNVSLVTGVRSRSGGSAAFAAWLHNEIAAAASSVAAVRFEPPRPSPVPSMVIAHLPFDSATSKRLILPLPCLAPP